MSSKKLPQINGGEVIKILSKVGFKVVRQKGSHVRIQKVQGNEIIKITVPVHSKALKKGTLRRIIKDAGLTVEEFLELVGN